MTSDVVYQTDTVSVGQSVSAEECRPRRPAERPRTVAELLVGLDPFLALSR
ncbi:hypothetical protein [Nocardia pseudobrasiliensis]|uniref:Uncharacterized protein n=1 Tax=Nocardia pseudobrasiliensis TaxID=45979 RepID=A0A370HQ04_9NOCA|nr:hypothetical protein [Nocardia pseudobrasiliensis]RDI60557.1 hypothetical protein DFR76_115187 [Nocardia pseudobrasiliensis]